MWKIEFKLRAAKELKKLDPKQSRQILAWLRIRLDSGADPRLFAEQLTGNFKEFWRFRIGDFRVVFQPHEQKLLILIVKVGHRRDVYKTVY
jgi:mRNA interferase RelE/StbE